MENPVIIFGAKHLAKIALDIFTQNGVVVYGFLEDDETLHGTEVGDISILGTTDDEGFTRLIGKKCEAFVALEDRTERKTAVEMLHEVRHTQPVNAVHPSAVVAPLASIGHGNLISAGAIVQPFATIGNHCLLYPGAILDTAVTLGDYAQIGTRSVIGTGVSVGENAFIGSGVTVVAGVKIGENARVGAGSVVVENVPEGATVFGNPAKKV